MNRVFVLCTVGLALAMTACPLGPFSGGRLSGDEEPAPGDWSFVAEVENCQLETNPSDPHSINCWCAGHGGNVYVPTSMILGPTTPTEREWVQNVEQDPDVRLRVDGRVFALRAVRVEDATEFAEVVAALEQKYEADPAEREAERAIWLYRLEAR